MRFVLLAAVTMGGVVGPLVRPAPAAKRSAKEKRVDDAVVRALKYLAGRQQSSGAWRLYRSRESTAATSLAVMAFLAAGHVPGEGPYARHLEKGIDWVLDQQVAINRRKGHETVVLVKRGADRTMYSHGISTLMLAEVVGMLKKDRAKRCRAVLEKSVRLIIQSQNVPKSSRDKGGWRYEPTSRDSDLSVTGWQLLALRASKDVGCDVPKGNIERAVAYVKRCRARRGRGFSYTPNSGATPTRTGTGILCLEVCGQHRSQEVMAAAESLLDRPLRRRGSFFFYGVYYCTVGMFKVGGKHWRAAKANTHGILLSSQGGDGSWRGWGGERNYGPVYCTAMSVLALAVEYRYLPIYQR
ncbi:MAG: prenyltransferase/squalene oxidase repeat-containing protein [Planctomycetaceae bacterium]